LLRKVTNCVGCICLLWGRRCFSDPWS